MKISTFLGGLAIATALATGCRDNRVLGTERNSSGASLTPPLGDHQPTPATATIVRAPEGTNEVDIASIPELSEPIWAAEANGEAHVPSSEPSADPVPEDCVANPGGQERQEAIEPTPR